MATNLKNISRKLFEAIKIVDHELLNIAKVMVYVQIWEFMSLITIISKIISIKKQNFGVPAASGGPYFNGTLLTVERSSCAASLTFIMEYGVSLK